MRGKLIALLAAPAILGAQQMTDTGAFRPISLQEALRLARQNNVSNIQAENSVEAAGNLVRVRRAAVLPTLNASAGQSKRQGQNIGQSGQLVDFTSDWQYSTGLSSQVTLFDAGKMFADVKTAKAQLVAAEAGEVATEYNIAQQVKLAYNSVLAAKESEGAAQAALATAQQQLAVSIAKVNAGTANVSDSLRNVVTVGNAQLALLQAQNAYRTASAQLTSLVATPYFVTAQLTDTLDRPLQPIDSAMVMQLALDGPAVRQAEATVSAQGAARQSAKASYLPTLTANLSYGGAGNRALYGLNDNPFAYTKSVQFSLNYPIFDRFGRNNNLANANINYENAQATARNARLQAQQGVITQIGNLRNAEASMRVQQSNVRAAEEDLRVVQQRYNLGASTILDVLTSQQSLVNARQQLITARFNYRNARAQIEAIIGRDLP
jgi:outer membrane protein